MYSGFLAEILSRKYAILVNVAIFVRAGPWVLGGIAVASPSVLPFDLVRRLRTVAGALAMIASLVRRKMV